MLDIVILFLEVSLGTPSVFIGTYFHAKTTCFAYLADISLCQSLQLLLRSLYP